METPRLDNFAEQGLVMTRAFPESLPTMPARRALYTGKRVFPFRGEPMPGQGMLDIPGWGPIPATDRTLAEMLQPAGYRTALISDVYHQFAPGQNYWRGFDEWQFLRGQESDPARSGPLPEEAELDEALPESLRTPKRLALLRKALANVYDRTYEEDAFPARLFREASRWLERNDDGKPFFLTIESFAPHEPWIAPYHYYLQYAADGNPPLVLSGFKAGELTEMELARVQAAYSADVTLCDRWFGHFIEQLRVSGLLETTLVIVTSDHGHALGDNGYCGKKALPATPDVYSIPLVIRFPGGDHGGTRSNLFVQHMDVSDVVLKAAGVDPEAPLDGRAFVEDALLDRPDTRNHVVIGWGHCVAVITEQWWFSATVAGTHCHLYDLKAAHPFAKNVGADAPKTLTKLFALALDAAGGTFPDYLMTRARREPGEAGVPVLPN